MNTTPSAPQFAPGWRGVSQFLSVALHFLSPLLLIGALIMGLILLDGYGAHRGMVQRMTEEGLETVGVISSVSLDHGWAFVNYEDAEGNARSGVLELRYYPADLGPRLAAGDSLAIRYLPPRVRSSDRVLLAGRLDEVRAYRGYLDPAGLIALGVCWAGVIAKPEILYLGFLERPEGSASTSGRRRSRTIRRRRR